MNHQIDINGISDNDLMNYDHEALEDDSNLSAEVKHYADQLSSESTETIQSAIETLSKTLAARRSQEANALLSDIKERAKALGFNSLHEFISVADKDEAAKGGVGSRKPVPIRYQDPKNKQNTWTGRGKRPKWLSALVDAGHDISEFDLRLKKKLSDSESDATA